MSTSTWGGPEQHSAEEYPLALLKNLLRQMMQHFAAQGAALALYDEQVGQMRVQLHLRFRPHTLSPPVRPPRRLTIHLGSDTPSSPTNGRLQTGTHSLEELEDVPPMRCDLFALGETYPIGQDLIGFTWQKNEAYVMRHEDYLAIFHQGAPFPGQLDVVPSGYLMVPISQIDQSDEDEARHTPAILGIVVLYQINPDPESEFQVRQRAEAQVFVERIALYLQNHALKLSQRRISEHLHRLQDISTAFPSSVKLADLVENIHVFANQMVDVSALLLTLYDRDTSRIYDVFALSEGLRIDNLYTETLGQVESERPIWCQVTQKEKEPLLFSPAREPHKLAFYTELLTGVWGDQRQAESFLLLPMKMYNRVVGSLSLVSKRPNAYRSEEVQVLETMVQIVTVGIENVKLYERDRKSLQDAKQRATQLAAINSTLQSIGSVLNINQLLSNFLKSVASLGKVEISVFFQPSSDKAELIAQAMYSPPRVIEEEEDADPLVELPPTSKDTEAELVNSIRLPFKTTILEQLVRENSFFYLDVPTLEELVNKSDEGGVLFLQAINTKQMLMIPMYYQSDLIGLLAVSTPHESRSFRPKDVGMLLAICAQTSSAIRNAQLFAQREEAYAALQNIDKLKDEFLVTASHELRTPLSAITGYSTMLKRQNARTSPQHVLRYATKIYDAAQQLADLVSKMTEAAKMGVVDKRVQIEAVQVRAAAEIAQNLLTLNSGQSLQIAVPSDLWVNADALLFRQVISNLLENAAKYSPHDTQIKLLAAPCTLEQVLELLPKDQLDPALLVEQSEKPVVLLRVQDQGEGILPEDQERIFEKFVRAPRSLTTQVRGSGLGLYICQRYVEAMAGKLWLERSVLNEGSIFAFYLPRTDPPIETGREVESE